MSESVSLPALGESVTEGTVTRWLKNVGDRVEVDEPLLEVSTDKVDTEIPSPVAGVVEAILVQEDETVEVGTPLVTIGDGSGSGAPEAAAPEAAAPEKHAPALGVVGIKAVAKPKPKPKPAPVRTESSASRSTQRVPLANVKQSSSEIVNIARTLLGIAYSYGGTSPSTGFDCSGFTQYVFGKAGISLPRTAADQQAAATPVSNPQPGDLVFFGSPAWHVGIYTGNGMMIDAGKPGEVTTERAIFSGVSGYGRF